MKKHINNIIFFLICFLSFLILFSSVWIEDTFGLIDMDKLLYHLFLPLKGTESGMINSYIYGPLLNTIVYSLVITIVVLKKYEYHFCLKMRLFSKINFSIDFDYLIKKYRFILIIILLLYSTFTFFDKLSVYEYINNLSKSSKFIEENYVAPESINISFDNKHKNLIHIFVESLEYTYASKDNGGAFDENLIPHLTDYAKEYVSFTNSNKGGFYTSSATGWTVAGMVAQTSGVALKISAGNGLGDYSKFLPGAYSIGQILEKEGYNQVLLIGSDATFAGRDDYFKNHGNYAIKDYVYAKNEKYISDNYYVWWGYEDGKLFEFAKKELTDLSNENQPFNLTLLTTDTHHIGGYLEYGCQIKFDEQFKNVIYCSDQQIYEFVEWIKKQSFYDDTVIVITGDHLSMDSKFFSNIESYERTNYNVFINSDTKPVNTTNRTFYAMDMYPTILASLGAKIDGDRLGLGTNLFSDSSTLPEKYGKDFVEGEYSKKSNYYVNHILFGL